jgi:hypothetical protein
LVLSFALAEEPGFFAIGFFPVVFIGILDFMPGFVAGFMPALAGAPPRSIPMLTLVAMMVMPFFVPSTDTCEPPVIFAIEKNLPFIVTRALLASTVNVPLLAPTTNVLPLGDPLTKPDTLSAAFAIAEATTSKISGSTFRSIFITPTRHRRS